MIIMDNFTKVIKVIVDAWGIIYYQDPLKKKRKIYV